MTDLHQQIADLEAQIDALSDTAERCRKGMMVAQVTIAGGLLVFGATVFGVIWSDPITLIVGIAATLAGIGFYGSSRSTREQTIGTIRSCEARRAEMINGLSLRAVEAP
jgi:hypothetical protein